MTQNRVQKFEQEIWYIIVNNETRGPLSLRDLDVLLRTSEINSSTYAWKNGMTGWKVMSQIQQIKQSILESSKEIFQIEKKRGQIQTKQSKAQQGQQVQQPLDQQTIENKDQNVMSILQATVDNLLQKTFHQTQDGKWNIYDEEKEEWIQQEEQPTERMQKMKKNLFNKLKSELFFGGDNQYKRNKKPMQKQEQQKELTKEELAKKQRNRRKTKRAQQKKKQKWYQAKVNTFVYITGLPMDVTDEELKVFCSKAGVLRIDLGTGTQKIKIYKDESGIPKGDAAVSYARQQSVDIALQVLNGGQIRSGFKVKVQRAQFQQKAEQYIPRESKKESKVKKIQAKMLQNKLFGWNQTDQQLNEGLKIIIIKNVFTPEIEQNDDEVQRLKQEIQKKVEAIGEVKRIRFFQTHPEGVVQVKFKNEKDAETCAESMDQTVFNGRRLECEYWDGQTDYKHNSVSLMLQDQRLDRFANQLENEEGKDETINEVQPQENNHNTAQTNNSGLQ